jgi:hypothetical protein
MPWLTMTPAATQSRLDPQTGNTAAFIATGSKPSARRQGHYPLQEVLLLCLLAVLAGAENFVEIARFGKRKIELLCRFLLFKDGTPSHDQLCDILQ